MLQELLSTSTPLSSSSSSSIDLDKWGLPPPTVEDIFPLLPEGTELIACSDKNKEYNLDEIQQALQGYLPLNLTVCFDSFGREKKPKSMTDKDKDDTTTPPLPMQLKLVHYSPPVLIIENFMTPQQCLDIQHVAMPPGSNTNKAFTSSSSAAFQVDSATFALAQSTRTSTSWFCHFYQVPVLIAKLHYVLGIPLSHMEEPQIVQYKTGQEFSWHYDQVPTAQLDNGGQRVATILVYLNTPAKPNESADGDSEDAGGATIFRDLRDDDSDDGFALAVQPVQGRCLIFFPATADGQPDDRTLHKGQVAIHEKKLVQVWIHQHPYRPILPPGNTQQQAWPAVQQAGRAMGLVPMDK